MEWEEVRYSLASCGTNVKRNEQGVFLAETLPFRLRVGYTLLLEGGDFVPNIKSVKKDVIKSRKNHLRNIAAKSAMKTFIKKARTAIDTAVAEPTTQEAI